MLPGQLVDQLEQLRVAGDAERPLDLPRRGGGELDGGAGVPVRRRAHAVILPERADLRRWQPRGGSGEPLIRLHDSGPNTRDRQVGS